MGSRSRRITDWNPAWATFNVTLTEKNKQTHKIIPIERPNCCHSEMMNLEFCPLTGWNFEAMSRETPWGNREEDKSNPLCCPQNTVSSFIPSYRGELYPPLGINKTPMARFDRRIVKKVQSFTSRLQHVSSNMNLWELFSSHMSHDTISTWMLEQPRQANLPCFLTRAISMTV